MLESCKALLTELITEFDTSPADEFFGNDNTSDIDFTATLIDD